MNDYKFGNFIYEQRTAKGLSQAELGKMLGVSNKAVSKWESGAAKPQTAKLYRLAQILEVSVEELLAGERKDPQASQTYPYSSILLRRFRKTKRTASVLGWITLALLLQILPVSGILVNLKVGDNVGAAYAGITILLLLSFLIAWLVNLGSARSQKKMLNSLNIATTVAFEPAPRAKTPTDALPEETSSSPIVPSNVILQYEFLKRKYIFTLLILIFIPLCTTLLLVLLPLVTSISGFATWVYFSNIWIPILLYALVGILAVLIVSIFRIVRARKILIHDHPNEWAAYVQKKPRSEKERKRMIADLVMAGWILLSILHLLIASSVFTFVIYSIVFLISYGYFLIRFYPRKHR